MGLFRFYFHQGKLITPSVCETEAGFFVDQGPLTVSDMKFADKVRQAIVKAFYKGNKRIPTPDGSEAAGSIILERLVIDSWSKFEKEAVLYTVHLGGRYTFFHVTGRGKDGMWTMDENSTRKFDCRATYDTLADAIIADIQRQSAPKPEAAKPMLLLPKYD